MLRGNALTRVAINEIRQFQRHELRVSGFQERYARMQRAEALPARYREVIILREFEELSILEIAERLRYHRPNCHDPPFPRAVNAPRRRSKITDRDPQRVATSPRSCPLIKPFISDKARTHLVFPAGDRGRRAVDRGGWDHSSDRCRAWRPAARTIEPRIDIGIC